MDSRAQPIVRNAVRDDVAAICQFGQQHIRPHYAPLIGAEAADRQVSDWWNDAHLGTAVVQGFVVVASDGAELLGVGQRGRHGEDHVVYKLYVHPQHRGSGLGIQLLSALILQLPGGAERLYIEHFVANERAGAFYEREGFTVDRIEPSPTGNPALGVVWRSRSLRSFDRTA
ncbi:GNAT family N-acetyltransferase [Arthrobacter tecti]